MPSSSLTGVLFGLLSALIWGSADFSGGFASRRSSPFQVVLLGSSAGTAAMALLAWFSGEGWPIPVTIAWALTAGIFGALGIAALYRGLSTGNVSLVAPTAAVIGAALPVVAGMLLEGLPRWTQSLGLLAGVLGIWQVSTLPVEPKAALSPAKRSGLYNTWRRFLGQPGLVPAILAGVAFSAFFVCLAQSSAQAIQMGAARPVFAPLVISKASSLMVAGLILLAQRQPVPAPLRNPYALLSGVLDVGGNLFFLLAQQTTRLDFAVIVSSMYPVSTVILAALVFKQKATRQQGLGLVLCLTALALIVA